MVDVDIRNADYDGALNVTIFEMLSNAGIGPLAGQRVLIKPNLLLAARPEQAVTTHPRVVRAVVQYVQEEGGRPVIADSPAVGSMRRISRVGAYREALQDLDIALQAFEAEKEVDIGPPFGEIPLARLALEADVVINLAKLKTHSQMTLTLGVKNTFGCIVGLKKPEWHMRAGIDKTMFARLVVQIHQAIRPQYTLIDGILGLEGHGPGKAGHPVQLGLLIGSRSALAADHAVCDLIDLPPERLPTLVAADDLGLPHEPTRVTGDHPRPLSFQLPDAGSPRIGPEWLQPFMRRHLIRRPVADEDKCRLCGECWQYCLAEAIACHDETHLRFDYNRCIRCYCCIEVCPHGAMRSAETLSGRLLRKVWPGHGVSD